MWPKRDKNVGSTSDTSVGSQSYVLRAGTGDAWWLEWELSSEIQGSTQGGLLIGPRTTMTIIPHVPQPRLVNQRLPTWLNVPAIQRGIVQEVELVDSSRELLSLNSSPWQTQSLTLMTSAFQSRIGRKEEGNLGTSSSPLASPWPNLSTIQGNQNWQRGTRW